MERVVSIAVAIIGVATVAVLVQSPNTAAVIRATGESFTAALRAAMGTVGK